MSLDDLSSGQKAIWVYQQPYENGSIELIKYTDLSDEIYENFDGANPNNEWLKSVNGIPIDQISEDEENISLVIQLSSKLTVTSTNLF